MNNLNTFPKVIQKEFRDVITHELGHAIYLLTIGVNSDIDIECHIEGIDGHTRPFFMRHLTDREYLLLFVAGHVMHSIVFGKDIVHRRGTDMERARTLATKQEIKDADNEVLEILTPYRDIVLDFVENGDYEIWEDEDEDGDTPFNFKNKYLHLSNTEIKKLLEPKQENK